MAKAKKLEALCVSCGEVVDTTVAHYTAADGGVRHVHCPPPKGVADG